MIKQTSPLLLVLSVVLFQPIGVTAQEMIRVSPTATIIGLTHLAPKPPILGA